MDPDLGIAHLGKSRVGMMFFQSLWCLGAGEQRDARLCAWDVGVWWRALIGSGCPALVDQKVLD